jgi:multiple sugar transport system substrate-binding protein
MSKFKRREFLKTTATVAAGAATGTLFAPAVHAQSTWTSQPEKGARLRVLRWSRFVQGDIDQYMANVKKFSDKYGIEVRVDSEGWEDVRPKAAVAANVGSGPDIILSTNDDANLYPEKLVDVTDVCTYLGKKYDGFYPCAIRTFRPDGKKWIGVPLGVAGVCMVYRESHMKAAGIQHLPARYRRVSQTVPGAEGERHAVRLRLGQCDRRWQHLVPMAGLGVRRQARRSE